MPLKLRMWVVACLLAGALFLSLYSAGQAFRSDEVWSLRVVELPYADMMSKLRGDIHPPLYYWLLAAWTGMFGTGEVAVRMLSLLLSLCAAGVIYRTGREFWGQSAGLLAAAIFIASPLGAIAVGMVRMYTLLALTAAGSTLGFLRVSRSGSPSKVDWVIYIAANIVGSFTHVWFFFLLLAQGITYLVFWRARRLPGMIAAAVASLAPYAVLWAPVLAKQVQRTGSNLAWVPAPTALELVTALLLQVGMFAFVVPFAVAMWRRSRQAKRDGQAAVTSQIASVSEAAPATVPAAVLFLLAALTILIPFALSFVKPVFAARFTIVALPATSLALALLARRLPVAQLAPGLMVAACGMAVVNNATGSLCDARAAAQYLAENTRPGDVVIFTNLSRLPIDYYWDRIDPDHTSRARIEERSFPAEIDAHPGFVGDIDSEVARGKLTEEAQLLTTSLEDRDDGRVFFLHGFRPDADRILKDLLDERIPQVETMGRSCQEMGSYFQYLAVFDCAEEGRDVAAR